MIQENKEKYLNLLRSVNRPGTENLIDYLENKSDFFISPASTKYHLSEEGGLCKHCLNVYDNMINLKKLFNLDNIADDSIIMVALLHDLGKVNFYEKFIKNEKVYDPAGTKFDNLGSYEWLAIEGYRVRDADVRFLGGDHAVNAVLLAGQFVPLRLSEQAAIINHHGNLDSNLPVPRELGYIYNRYPLATLLHLADVGATFFLESKSLNE